MKFELKDIGLIIKAERLREKADTLSDQAEKIFKEKYKIKDFFLAGTCDQPKGNKITDEEYRDEKYHMTYLHIDGTSKWLYIMTDSDKKEENKKLQECNNYVINADRITLQEYEKNMLRDFMRKEDR